MSMIRASYCLSSIATLNANRTTITGLDNVAIGATTPSSGAFTTLSATGTAPTFGTSTGVTTLIVSGGNSGATDGGAIYFKGGGTTVSAIGMQSPIIGGGYSANLLLYTTGASIVANIGGSSIATFTSTGLAVTGGITINGNNDLVLGNANYGIVSGGTRVISCTNAGVAVTGTLSATGLTNTTGGLSVYGTGNNSSGPSIEIVHSGTIGYIRSYNRTGPASMVLKVNDTGGNVEICSAVGVFSSTGLAVTGIVTASNGCTITGAGLQLGAPTGGDKGAGTANFAADIYKNNAAYTNPDYVLEHWATGKIVRFKDKEGATSYSGLKSLKEVESFARKNLHLPRFGQAAGHGLFSGSDAVLASLEEAYLYIFDLEKRIAALES